VSDASVVAALRERSSTNESLVYAHHVFAEVDALVRRYAGSGTAILEIGPGANLGALFCFAASGWTRVAGIDVAEVNAPSPEFYATLRDYLSVVGGWRWWRQFATAAYANVTFPKLADGLDAGALLRSIDYRAPVAVPALPFEDGAFDVVYSVAAMEHIEDPRGMVAEMHRVLRRGGVAIHEIDLTHHGSIDPLKFLEWGEDEWAMRTRAEHYGAGHSEEQLQHHEWGSEVYCNRVRHAQWLELFTELELLHDEPVIVYDRAQIDCARFAEPFRSMTPEALSVLAFRIVARKVA
jgi:SAM-dependent methyltransferase